MRVAGTIVMLAAVLGALTPVAADAACAERLPDVRLTARAMQPGEVVGVDIRCTSVNPLTLVAFGRDIPLARSADGTRWRALVGIDLGVAPGRYPLVLQVPGTPGSSVQRVLDVQPKQFPTRTLRVAERFVEPPVEVLSRIRDEAALLERTFNTATPRPWNGRFMLPVLTPPTRNFGSRSVFNGEARNPHAGIDFASPAGTLVTSPAAGEVVLVQELFFTGSTVVVDHGNGAYSLMAHLSSTAVAPGEVIGAGAPLGRVGATGRATGPHLHWTVRLHGARVDPLSLIAITDDYRTDAPVRDAVATSPPRTRDAVRQSK